MPNLWCSAPAPGCQTPVPASEVTPCFRRGHRKCKNNWNVSPPFTALNPECLWGRKTDGSLFSSTMLQLQVIAQNGEIMPFTHWLLFWGQQGSLLLPLGCWEQSGAILEQTKAELHLGVRALQTTGAFPSFTSYSIVTTMLGFKTKSSPSADLRVSGECLEERNRDSKRQTAKIQCLRFFLQLPLCCAQRVWSVLESLTGHWQTLPILSPSVLLELLCARFWICDSTILSPPCLEGRTAAFIWHRY